MFLNKSNLLEINLFYGDIRSFKIENFSGKELIFIACFVYFKKHCYFHKIFFV